MLTRKQRDLLLYIQNHMQEHDIAPSFDEMKQAAGLKSKSGIHRLISALEERGYIRRLQHRARALEIIKPIEIEDANDWPAGAHDITDEGTMDIPLHGKIAAGTPIEAIRDEVNQIAVPLHMASNGMHYALEVDGDSMIKAGIHDGDTVVIERCTDAPVGTIIVALVDGEDVTLKRLRRAGNKVILEPENDDFEPQVLEPERVVIQGRLVGLMRTYH